MYRFTEDWTSDNINWVNAPRYSTEPVATSSNDKIKEWENYDVTTEIKKIVEGEADNFGFALVLNGIPYGVVYRSSESTTIAERPKLIITCEDNEAPTVSIINPGEGQTYKLGSSCKIAWDITDLVGVVSRSIYFSSGNSTWKLIDSSEVSNGSGLYKWELPNVVSDNCTIKINAYDAAGNVGTKESGAFAIVDPSGIKPMIWGNTSYTHADRITITNVQGKILDSFELTNMKQLERIKGSLYSGLHFITITNPNRKIVKKVLFVK